MKPLIIFGSLSISELLIVLLFTLIPIVLCVERAGKLNRNKLVWGILGLIFNFVAVLVIFVLAESKEKKL